MSNLLKMERYQLSHNFLYWCGMVGIFLIGFFTAETYVPEVMGGKVLNYRSKEIYLEGCAFGRKEGQKESIVQLVTRKYQLGDSPEKIAKDLLMSEEEVEEILGKTTGSQQ